MGEGRSLVQEGVGFSPSPSVRSPTPGRPSSDLGPFDERPLREDDLKIRVQTGVGPHTYGGRAGGKVEASVGKGV